MAEVESSQNGEYELGTNMLTVADCRRQIRLEFFLGNRRERKRSLAKARLLADVINIFYESRVEESKLIDKANEKTRDPAAKQARKT